MIRSESLYYGFLYSVLTTTNERENNISLSIVISSCIHFVAEDNLILLWLSSITLLHFVWVYKFFCINILFIQSLVDRHLS